MITDFDVFDQLAAGYHDTGAFVAAYEGQLGGDGPVAIDGVEVGVADARVFDVDEDFVRAGLGDCAGMLATGFFSIRGDGVQVLPGICLYSTGPPVFSMTIAHCFSGMF